MRLISFSGRGKKRFKSAIPQIVVDTIHEA